MVMGKEHSFDAQRQSLVRHLCHSQLPDHATDFAGKTYVFCSKRADAFHRYIFRLKTPVERQLRQDFQLLGSIVSVDIESRIGLGETFHLCFLQSVCELHAIVGHASEYVIAGAVQDAAEALNFVSNQPTSERAHDGNATAYAGLESEADILQRCRPEKIESIGSQQRFVGGNYMFTAGQRAMDKTSGRFDSAYQFNHHVATVFDDFLRARGEKSVIDARPLFFL